MKGHQIFEIFQKIAVKKAKKNQLNNLKLQKIAFQQ